MGGNGKKNCNFLLRDLITVSHTFSEFSPSFCMSTSVNLEANSPLGIHVQAGSYTSTLSSISKKVLWEGCAFPLLHYVFTACHYHDKRTKKDFREVGIVLVGWRGDPRWSSTLNEPSFLSISSAHKTNCCIRIKFLMALTDKQAQHRLNSASCFETEHEIMIPKPHQHKAHLQPIRKIKHMS